MKTNWRNIFFFILIGIIILFIISWFFGFDIPNLDDIKRQNQINNPTFNTGLNCSQVIQDCINLYQPIPDSYCSQDKALIKHCEAFCMGKSVELRETDLNYKSYECNDKGILICNC